LLLGQRFLCRCHSAFGQLLAALLHSQRILPHCHSAFCRLSAALLHGQRVLLRLRSAFGRLLTTMFGGQCFIRRLRSVFGRLSAALLHSKRFLCICRSALVRLLAALLRGQRILLAPLVSLIGYGLCLCGGHLLTLFLRLQRASAAFLLMLQVGKSGLTLLSPRGLASKPGMEALMAKPQEDGLGCRHLSCLGSTLATRGLFIEDALATQSLLAFEGSAFVKKALSGASSLLAGSLLAFMGDTLVKKALTWCRLEAVALVLP
jgi:hypothetical protein